MCGLSAVHEAPRRPAIEGNILQGLCGLLICFKAVARCSRQLLTERARYSDLFKGMLSMGCGPILMQVRAISSHSSLSHVSFIVSHTASGNTSTYGILHKIQAPGLQRYIVLSRYLPRCQAGPSRRTWRYGKSWQTHLRQQSKRIILPDECL